MACTKTTNTSHTILFYSSDMEGKKKANAAANKDGKKLGVYKTQNIIHLI